MFSDRLDSLMNIARLSNTQMAQKIHLDSSYIGRLRNGARPLPKKHAYLRDMCTYLASKILSDGHLKILTHMIGLPIDHTPSSEELAAILEKWLLANEEDNAQTSAAGRFISGFTQFSSAPPTICLSDSDTELPLNHIAPYLYGNDGKRRAVEQFFLMILAEEKPQTLLLFSEENMEWLYEDPAFAKRWAQLFTKVIQKGNRVKIIHTVSRNLDEIMEAVMKWIPIYMTGAIEPYCYPRIRDDLFQHTLFIAPETAAIVSQSVRQDTSDMLNAFITDKSAIHALVTEYDRYFKLCRPLMKIYTSRNKSELLTELQSLHISKGGYYIRSAVPPLFTLPRSVVEEINVPDLKQLWEKDYAQFEKSIQTDEIRLILLDPDIALLTPNKLILSSFSLVGEKQIVLTPKQYQTQLDHIKQLTQKYPHLHVRKQMVIPFNNLLYVKDQTGVVMAKTDVPSAAFLLYEQNMTYAFEGYFRREFHNSIPFNK